MSSLATARLAAVTPAFLQRATATTVEDWLAYVEPDGIVLTGAAPAPRAMNTLRRHCPPETVLSDPAGGNGKRGPVEIGGIQFCFAPDLDAVEAIARQEADQFDTDEPTYVVSNLLELDVDTTTLSTTLVGKDAYSEALGAEGLDGEYVHISTALPAEYRQQWDGLSIVGGGDESGASDSPLVALDCRSDGEILTHTVRPDRLGLQALDRVGSSRARTLREAGYTSRELIASADRTRLADLAGIGTTTAGRIQQSAEAISRGEVVRTGSEPLPDGDPVFVDIETDGLSPTITWLVGVLDGSASGGNYISFLQTDPDDPGRAIEDFVAWYTANASHRPLVAYNGWRFDFEVLHEQLVEHCSHYAEDWTSTYRFDPYQWAVTNGNAILPGRTNKLEDVAAALGYEREEEALTGAAVARQYRQWMADRSPETEPDWERFSGYCEDDVRALAVVYDALEASGRIESNNDDDTTTQTETTQGTLSEW
ncbi:MAG: ribonuclease H-like domain-containing protein [Halovenus sp.]